MDGRSLVYSRKNNSSDVIYRFGLKEMMCPYIHTYMEPDRYKPRGVSRGSPQLHNFNEMYQIHNVHMSVILCRTYNLRPGWIIFNVELF